MSFLITSVRSQNITAAEYFVDTDPGKGNGVAVSISAPGDIVNFTASVPTVSLSTGFHFLAVRVKDANGIWGLFEKRGFYISTSTSDAANITAAEYFFDADPGVGNGIALSVGASGATVNFAPVIPTSLSAGFHFLAIRVKGANGIWGMFEKRGFYISSSTTDVANIVAAEYFFDADPGTGNGIATSVGASGAVVNFTATIPTSLSAGFHFLAIRTKNASGIWGMFEKRGFYISSSTTDAANITAAEYFFDTDPGVGNGIATSVGASGAVVNFTATIPTSLTSGFHFLAIRTKGADGKWGLFEKRGFYISTATANSPIIVAAEYFFDADPGVGNGNSLTVTTPGNTVTQTFNIPAGALPLGQHFVSIRVKDQSGKWGLYEYDTLNIGNSTISCHADTTLNTTIGNCSAIVNGIDPAINIPQAYTYTLSGATTGSGSGTASGQVFNAGTTTVLYKLTASPTVNCTFTVTVNAVAPVITIQPLSQIKCVGENITFSVTATGNSLSYQWRKGGVNISGANSNSFTITGLVIGDAGNYDVVVSTTCGTNVTSGTAILTVNIPPAITIQPVSQIGCPGDNISFSVTATGTGLTYQWRKAGVNIAGATSNSYTINSIVAGNAGNYDVVVSGICLPPVTSNTVTLTVNVPPAISIQPTNQIVCAGNNVTFNVTATGTALTYQWRKAGVNIAGATSSSYTITGVVTGNAGNYDVVVSGYCPPSVTSVSVSLTVNTAAAIVTQPLAQTICAGANVTFNVSATGTGLSYQWRKGSINIAGATSSSYTITGAVAGDAGSYDVVITGTCPPAITSNSATLTVNPITVIGTQPASQTVCAGSNVSFNVIATGTGVLTYQWKKNNVDITGATSSSYTLNAVTAVDAANYTVVVSGTCGTVTSSAAVLIVNATTVITSQPVNQSSCPGGSVTYLVTATGTGVLTYQWKKNGIDILGATSSGYTINPVTAGDAASYTVVVTGTCGTLTSNAATLTITAGTVVNIQPANQSSCLGGNVTFNVSASGSGTVTYQWKKNAVNIGGATSASYTINPVTAGDVASYSVVVASLCGSTTSNSATLSIIPATVITTQPVSQTVCSGNNVTFTVLATGDNLAYQWRKAGVNIGGALSSSYTITGVTAGDVSNYDVIVTGTCGTVTSNTVSLSLGNIVISTQPVSQTICSGTNVTFSVVATGTGITYQWRKNGVNIGGATSASFTLTGAVPGDAGIYDVVINGTCLPAVTSNSATLTVNTVTVIVTQPVSQTICAGNNVTFTVAATGTALTYQWRKGGVNIGGATSPSFVINGALVGDAGNFDVVVTGTCGTVISSSISLVVNTSPSIITQPASQTICAGSNVTFSVSATGSSLTYQWRKGGLNIGGAISSSYNISGVVAGDAGTYDVVINGACTPSVTSSAATLIVNAITAIATQPVSQIICAGSNVTFSVTATGTALNYQWRKGGVNIGGAINSSFTITGATVGDAGNYDVVVTGTCGSLTSSAAVLNVNAITSITAHPVSQAFCSGNNVSFSVTALGANLSYQWRKNTVNIAGANSSSLAINNAVAGDAGSYDVVVTGSCGTVTSNAATLTVNAVTAITTQPVNQTSCEGSNITLTVIATGTALSYQWRKGGANISGATSSSFTITGAVSGDAGNYDVVVTGLCGTVTSSQAILSINVTGTWRNNKFRVE